MSHYERLPGTAELTPERWLAVQSYQTLLIDYLNRKTVEKIEHDENKRKDNRMWRKVFKMNQNKQTLVVEHIRELQKWLNENQEYDTVYAQDRVA